MSVFSYKRIDVTRHCTANCSHCSEHSYEVDLWTPLDELKLTLQIENDPLETVYLLSGGEPFEAPNRLRAIVKLLESKSRYFRIATGNHVSLKENFSDILFSNYFVGISIGTDVIHPKRNQNNRLKSIWKDNLSYLIATKVSYSLTVSFTKDDNGTIFEHLAPYHSVIDARPPTFIMLIAKNIDLDLFMNGTEYTGYVPNISSERILKCAV